MKRNLSSQAIRAMAIGMAVTLGSATAVSGVVTGTVVNVYAANFEQSTFAEAKIEKESTDLKITITAAAGKKFSGSGDLTGLVVKTADGSKEVANKSSGVTPSIEGGDVAGNKLVIKVPISELSPNTLTGKETSLKITSLKSTSVKYGDASGSQDSLAFDTGDFTLNTNSSSELDIDNTAPTLQGATATYKNENSKFRVEITLKNDTLATLGEQQSSDDKFTVKPTSSGAIGSETNDAKVTAYEVSSGKLILTLNKELVDGKYTVTYAKKDTQLKDEANNELVQSSNNTVELTVTSAPQVSAPLVETTKYDENSKIITLTLNKELNDQIATEDKEKHGFVVKNSSKEEQVIKQVTVKGKEVIIELGIKDNLVEGTYTIGYTKKDRAEFVVAKDGGKLDTNENLATFKVNAAVKPPAQGNLTATTNVGTYTFEKVSDGVALVKFEPIVTKVSQATNKFENGVFTDDTNTSYNLVQIGNGSALTTLTDDALKGHTTNVTEIKPKAFEKNTTVTTLSFPKVTNVGANAFNGATSLTTIDLGSQADKTTVDSSAFTGAIKIANVTTNKASKTDVETAAQKGNKDVKVDVSISEDKYNEKDAKIEKDKFYQTKDGLLFKGLEAKDRLTFMGKEEFTAPTQPNTLDGSKEKPYFVTFSEGKVTLQSEKTSEQPPVEENTFTAEIGGKTGTFEKIKGKDKEVSLIKVADKVRVAKATTSGSLQDGELTVGAEKYNLTQLGNGTESLGNFESSVLEGNLGNVTTVKEKAFDGNKTITTISLPAVKEIEANAFNGTTALTTIDLGNNEVTIGTNAFKGANSNVTIKTNNDKTKENITANGGNSGITVENPAPEVVSGEVNKEEQNYVLTLTLSEKVFAAENPENSDFTVKSGNSGSLKPNEVKNIDIKNNSNSATNTVKLTLTKAVNKGDTVTVAYSKNIAINKQIKDTSTNDTKVLDNFADNKITVVNNIEDSPVQTTTVNITEAKVNKNTVTLTTKESNLDNATINKGSEANVKGFVFKKGGSNQVNITKVVVANNNTITLTLESPISESDSNLTFEYTGGSDDFKVGGKKIDNIASKEVINETNDAPTISNGTANKTQKLITLTASEDLNVMSNANNDFGFTVKNSSNSSALTVTKVEVKNQAKNKIEITVSDNLTSIDALKVTYTKPSNEANQIKDSKGALLENIEDSSAINVNATRAIAQSDSDFAVIAIATDTVEVVKEEGTITGITSVKGATQEQINSILTSSLTKIDNGAFNGISNMKLDFSKVNLSNLVIDKGAFSGATGIEITNVKSGDTEKLAEMIGSSSDIKINGKTTEDIIKDNSNSGNGGSGGGSSSGGSGGGSGANIGTITNKDPNTEETTSQGNNNNETVVENKQLSFDVIKLPSVEGEAKMFGDVSANHWAKSYIDKLSTAGIINGSNGMFNPNGQTKRADVTIMLVNLLGLTPEANNKFADVNASAYYAPYVGTASTYGIVNGSNGMFNPQGVISRQDTMVMIAQILKGLNLNVNADTTSLSQFGDASKVSAYANESVAILVNSGIIAGNNGKLNPTAPVTRAEMATIMSKLYDVLASANK